MPTDPMIRRFVFYWEGSPLLLRPGAEMPNGDRVTYSEQGTSLYTSEQWRGHCIRMVVVGWLDPPAFADPIF